MFKEKLYYFHKLKYCEIIEENGTEKIIITNNSIHSLFFKIYGKYTWNKDGYNLLKEHILMKNVFWTILFSLKTG